MYVCGIGIDYPQESIAHQDAKNFQLIFTSGGSGTVTIGDKTYDLTSEYVLYLREGVECHYQPRSNWVISWLTFDFGVPACANTLFLNRDHCVIKSGGANGYKETLHELYECVSCGGKYGSYRASAMLYNMLIRLNGHLKQMPEYTVSGNRIMESILAYIDQNYTHDIMLNQLCEAAGGLSEQYLCRLFKQSTGIRPIEYILRKRVSIARMYLEKTDMPISEIAVAAGFHNTSYFYRNFRKFVGVSPLIYRQNAMGLTESDRSRLH